MKIVFGLLGGFCVILIAAWFSGSTGKICNEGQTAHEQCTTYNLAPFILIQIVKFLDSINTVITAISTAAVAVFTYTLSISTKALWSVTKTAADAADLSARAAIALELPLIRAAPIGFKTGTFQNKHEERYQAFGLQCFEFTNRGRTKAFPIELHWGWVVSDKLPSVPEYKRAKSFDLNTTINETDGVTLLYVQGMDMRLSDDDVQGIYYRDSDAPTRLWLYCQLTYEDFMYEPHTIGFCWKYFDMFGGGKFIADATPAYNQRT